MQRVLVIEDDDDIAGLVSIHLKELGCEVVRKATGETGLDAALQGTFDLIVLDIMLGGIDGIEVCRRLRAKENWTPILMLTARSEEIDKILGLETGADDYLTKPFSVREFTARVKAIFRRVRVSPAPGVNVDARLVRAGKISVDPEKHKVLVDGNRIDLTPKEYNLLLLLMSHPGKNYSREDLLNLVWGYEFSGYEHTVNSHINRLRSKIEPDFSKPVYILTSWGVGYRFNDEIPND